MPSYWRIIDTGPCDPCTNMALDEALLLGYLHHRSPPTLRVYSWEPAGISLGYSQDARKELDLGRCREFSLPLVRRITGGGIIIHGRELTYSLVGSEDDLRAGGQVGASYKSICSFLVAFYRTLGLDARFACDAAPGERLGAPSALCFAGREKHDIVVRGRKIGGSAQRRMKRVIFQHGSIPLRPQDACLYGCVRGAARQPVSASSLEELLERPVACAELTGILIRSFADTFGVTLLPRSLYAEEVALFEVLKKEKYGSDEWNIDRTDITKLYGHEPARMGQ